LREYDGGECHQQGAQRRVLRRAARPFGHGGNSLFQ
jgi:hypothetical protein